MIKHAISSFEEVNSIVARVRRGERIILYKTNYITPLDVIEMDGNNDKVNVHKGRPRDVMPEYPEYCVLQITNGNRIKTISFYLSGDKHRAYLNYWHAYAHQLMHGPATKRVK